MDAFLPSLWVDDAIVKGRRELAAQPRVRYTAAVDPSGGGEDAFTMAVCHVEGDRGREKVVQDVLRGWTRGRSGAVDLESVTYEIARILVQYRVRTVHGDGYASNWTRQAFDRTGVRYELTKLDRTAAYLETEPLFAQGRVQILDHAALVRELKLLERRPRPGGRDRVGHPHGGHDDHANATCLAAALAVADVCRPRPGVV